MQDSAVYFSISMKLSEKSQKGLHLAPQAVERGCSALFVLRVPAESTLGALLVPLFGRFLYMLW
jgi:hypothetical protein